MSLAKDDSVAARASTPPVILEFVSPTRVAASGAGPDSAVFTNASAYCRCTRRLLVVTRAFMQLPSRASHVLQVYSIADIPWILLLGQPNPTTEALFGDMRHEGSFPTSRLSDAEQRFVFNEIREHGFARIPKATARMLLSFPPRMLKRRLTRWLPFRPGAASRA